MPLSSRLSLLQFLYHNHWLSQPVVMLLHLFLCWLGLQVPFYNEHVSIIWPASGLALAVIWRLGYIFMLPLAGSALLLNYLQELPPATNVGFALGSVLGPALAVWLIKLRKLRHQLDTARDMAGVLLLGIGVGALLSATNGTLQLWFSGMLPTASLFSTAMAWWFGDSFGLLLLAVPLLTYRPEHAKLLVQWRFWYCQLTAVATSLFLFWSDAATSWPATWLFLPLLPLLWAVMHLGLWATSLQILLIAVLSVTGTVQGYGIFTQAEPLVALFNISAYMLVIGAIAYFLAFMDKSGSQTRADINSALEGTGLGIWQLDIQRDHVELYGQAERMLGYQPGELSNSFLAWADQVHPDDAAMARQVMLRNLKGETPLYQTELRLRHKAGHYVWVLVQGRVIEREPDGQARRMVGSNTDISALKLADLEVSRLKDFYESVLSRVVTGVWVGDSQHRLIYVNQGICHLLSMTEANLLGKQVLSDFPDQTLLHFRPHYYRALHGLTPMRFEAIPIENPAGQQLFISGWLVPMLKDGQFAGMIGTADDITRQQLYEQQILQLAFVDQLTGLPNRTAVLDKARDLLAVALQQQQQLVVYLIDLDHFQHINDAMGHETGDQLLKQVAERLQMLLMPADLLGRPGGDEFALIRQCRTEHDVLQTAHQLILAMAEPFAVEDRLLQVSPSIGIAMFPQHGLSFAELQRMAEIALYAAKAAGRNRYCLYTPQMSVSLQDKLQLEHGMRSGLYAGQFSLHYQPIQQLQSQQIETVEVLLRWQHPQLGAVSPMRFVPLAEQSGFITELGDWVLQQALQQQARWQQQGIKLKVAVNISTVQLRHPDFVSKLQQQLHNYGIAGHQLELELTESVLADQVEQTRLLLQQIRHLGVTLALDDFGTGYSSLAYLKSFPINKLKIDRSFVRDLLTDPDDRAIVHSMVVLGHSLGLEVLAEGVEAAGQLHLLQQLQIDSVQGFFFSKPLPALELENWLRRVHSQGLQAIDH